MAAPEEDFSALPLTERVSHKVWKARVSAYEELTKLWGTSEDDNDFKTYEGFLKKIATDANAVAQETGLIALLAFAQNAPNPTRARSSVVPAVVEKGFGSARAGTKRKAVDVILMFIEVDVPDPVVEDVINGLNAKQPKLVATTVSALKEIISNYGAKTVNVKPILKTLPKIFGHTDKTVRSEGTQLVIELYKWLGQAINPHLQELKPVQVKELNEAFEKLPPEKPKQLRLLRSQAAAAAEAEAEAQQEEAEEEKEIDAFDLAEPVDVLAKVPKDFYTALGSTKWKERKEALDGLLEVCNTPRIADGNFSELIPALAKRMNDSNIIVVSLAANIIELLAKGLRNDFSKHKSVVVGPIVEKLKEKKKSVSDTLAKTLDAIFLTVTLSDVVEDIVAAGKHKNPQVKTESINWLVRCLKTTKVAPNKTELKALSEMLVKACEDSMEPVRVAAMEGLGTMMKIVGDKAMIPFLEGLDDIKKGKIKEFCEKAEVKAKATTVKRPTPAPTTEEKPKPKTIRSPNGPPKKKAEAASAPTKSAPSGPPKKSVKAAKPSPAAAAPPPPKKGGKAKEEEPIKYKYTDEDVEAKFGEIVSSSQTDEISDKQWKIRLAAITSLRQTLDSMDPAEVDPELVVRFLRKKPGWKESNYQVMSEVFGIMQMLSDKSTAFSKPAASLAISILAEKLGDIKLKKPAGECLTSFAEKTSLQFVLTQAYEPLRKAKSPKTVADGLTWIHSAVMEFGIAGLQVRDLIDFLKFTLSNTNAAVRANSVTVLGALRIYVGPGVRNFVQDLNPTQLATIDAEFEKVADQAPPQPTKSSAESKNSAGDALDELFPKVDIGALITGKIVADCNSDKWKTRKEGMDQVKAIVDANQRLKPNLGDFPPVLKARLADSNKNLQMMALEICGKIATAMGKPFDRYVKIFVGPVTNVLTDQKATVRGSAISTLDAMANACGLDPLISSLATSLANENPLLRKDLLNWLSDRLKEFEEKKKSPDLSPLVTPILSCLSDRNGDVRKSGQACLGPIINSAGYDHVVQKCGDLKGAIKQQIMPMIEAARPASGGASKVKDIGKKPGPKSRSGGPSGGVIRRIPGLGRGSQIGLGRGAPAGGSNTSAIPNGNGETAEHEPPSTSGLPTFGHGSNLPSAPRGLQPPSGIGRGLPPPSRLQFSRLRKPGNALNGQSNPAPASEAGSNKDVVPMDIDQPDHIAPTAMEAPSRSSIPGPFSNKNRVATSERSPEIRMDYIINRILNADPQQSIEALKDFDKELNNSSAKVAGHVDELVNALALQIRFSYTKLEPQAHTLIRLCKHLVNALVLLFSNKELALSVSQEYLTRLLQELAHRLLDPNLQVLECGQQLSKALNVAMVKVLENSDRNATALISILETSSANLREVEDSASSAQVKFTELIMKCLWKLAKSVQENLKAGVLKPNMLLRDLNNFFLVTPPAEWKRRATEKVPLGEMPLRTVKTLLLELVTGLGDGVYDHLDLIEDPQRSYVYPYLHHMLDAYRKKAGQQVPQPNYSQHASQQHFSQHISQQHQPSHSRGTSISSIRSITSIGSDSSYPDNDSARGSPAMEQDIQESTAREPPPREMPTRETPFNGSESMSPTSPRTPMSPRFPTLAGSIRTSGSHELEVNSQLTRIFQKIGTPRESRKGIQELYEFQKEHPEMESKISAQLETTSFYFQSYIRRGLSNIATEEEEKQRASMIAEARNVFPASAGRAESVSPPPEDEHKQKLLKLAELFGYPM